MVRRRRRPVPWQKQAGERIRVVDIFDEVEEDLRAERAGKLLKKYAGVLVAMAVAVVATAAGWRAATLKADAGDLQGAEALWNAVAADSSADPLLRDFASLMATGRDLDHGDPAQLEARLKPLADPTNAWSSLAREQLAMLDLRQGRVDEARKTLQALSIDIDAPAGLRARASALLTGLGGPDGK
jgi:hypothetical protein